MHIMQAGPIVVIWYEIAPLAWNGNIMFQYDLQSMI
jgi:hypothetical protein